MVLILTIFGCVQRHQPFPPPGERGLDVAPVLESPDAVVLDAPARLDAALLAAVRARQLEPRLVPTDRFLEPFARQRETAQRVALLGDAAPVLLVETRPRLFGLVRGHWRWVVEVRVTLEGETSTFEAPVFLANPGDDADDAVVAAAPEIARRAGEVLDRWVAAR
jgi:hypothetical protein